MLSERVSLHEHLPKEQVIIRTNPLVEKTALPSDCKRRNRGRSAWPWPKCVATSLLCCVVTSILCGRITSTPAMLLGDLDRKRELCLMVSPTLFSIDRL